MNALITALAAIAIIIDEELSNRSQLRMFETLFLVDRPFAGLSSWCPDDRDASDAINLARRGAEKSR